MRIALVDSGSMGMVIGALVAMGGEDISLVDIDKAHVKTMNEKGARITGHMEVTVPVKAVTPQEMEGIYELVICLAKTTYGEKALPQILPHINKRSTVITMQNGVPEEKVVSMVGEERTLGGAIGWGAKLVKPGVSELTSEPEVMTYDVGELDGSETRRVNAVKAVLDKAGQATITSNLLGVRWTKLLVNVSFSGLGSVLSCAYSEILDNDKALIVVVSIIVETMKTARALGIEEEPMQGVGPNVLLDVIKESEESALNVVRMVWERPPGPGPQHAPGLAQGPFL
ncbi:MAG: 2-dehydropantoate 2-reductase N-terminal domain-containing protein [Actinomycetota bacterium]|nr:2-dehydropantoate 2-reductase N-terminal domain-containing protein [Actinomycetota bacterium]